MAFEIEILTLLGEFVILLISISTATYAIAASLLGHEYSKAKNYLSKEKDRAERELNEKSKITPPIPLETYEKSVENFRAKERNIKDHLKPLSLWRVVILPNIFFGLAFILIAMMMYYFPLYADSLLVIVITLIVVGLIDYGYSLNGIRKIAEKIEEEIE